MLRFADRIKLLGTETAFAVSADAAAWQAKGNKIYPFHLGDINLPTPSNIIESTIKAMHDGKTTYCPNAGIVPLREAIANEINKGRGTNYRMENVVVQPGGKPVIGKTMLALMNPGEEVLYPNPGYPIYESQIEFNGGKAVPYAIVEGKNNFEIDLDDLKSKITPKTKVLIVNSPHNPTAQECSDKELQQLADIATRHNLIVLSDEAYFDIHYEGISKSITSLPGMQERTVILYTFSKKFAMPGWRLGAAIGPASLMDVIAKLNVNEESCSNHFIQYGALEGLNGDLKEVKAILNEFRARRDLTVDMLNSIPGVHCFRPTSTFYVFPEVTELMATKGYTDYETFRKDILYHTGFSFCTRAHFGRPSLTEKRKYIRLAYSAINKEEIREGLTKFKNFLISEPVSQAAACC